jgi:hypothetical protein
LLTTTVQPNSCLVKWAIVIIIIVVWLVTTLRYGPGWLTPVELAFFALILNPSPRSSFHPELLKGADS